jgi:Uma2 family endonuclease
MDMADMIQTGMTSAEYWDLPETNRIEELIDGEIIVSPTPLDVHQESSGDIYSFLSSTLQTGVLRYAPTGIHFEEGFDLEPDIFWISPDNDHCFLAPDGRYWHGAPDLIVEILPPSTAYRDRGVKFEIYEKHGVREYWLVDPEAKFLEVYQGQFKRLGIFTKGQTFTSAFIGTDVPIDSLFVS